MRQRSLDQFKTIPRITRGNSNLPKLEPENMSSSSHQLEESHSQKIEKTKKIHHMTIRAMERKKKIEEEAAIRAKELEQNHQQMVDEIVEVKIPKKKGRKPKNYYLMLEQEEERRKKEEIKQSAIAEQSMELANNEDENNLVKIAVLNSGKDAVELQKEGVEQISSMIPKQKGKRGRKKKVIEAVAVANQKLYTVPKLQTFENYNLYYDKIIASTKAHIESETPMIFDKINKPAEYWALVNRVHQQQPSFY